MTLVSNDPNVWPLIHSYRVLSYFIAASCAAVAYDWALTFGQEFELVWSRRWSLMSVLYIGLRYIGIFYATLFMLITVTDAGCNIMYPALTWMAVVANAMLGVIMIIRLYAMYQQSRQMLIFLIVIFLAVTIACAVITGIANRHISGEQLILPGTRRCVDQWEADAQLLLTVVLAIYTVWEVLVLCLTVWIVVKHFRELRRTTSRWSIGDYFTVLLKTHVVYFTSFAAAYCLQLGFYSREINDSFSLGTAIYDGILTFASVVQMFVLGPRLILSIREYHTKLTADRDVASSLTTIAFQERARSISTGGGRASMSK